VLTGQFRGGRGVQEVRELASHAQFLRQAPETSAVSAYHRTCLTVRRVHPEHLLAATALPLALFKNISLININQLDLQDTLFENIW
jgi:hypothetical protein